MKSRASLLQLSRNWHHRVPNKISFLPAGFGAVRHFTPTMDFKGKIQPAKRVAGRKQDVWYVGSIILLILFIFPMISLEIIVWLGSLRGVIDGGRCCLHFIYLILPLKYTNKKSRTIVNEAAAASPVQPIVNMGQGFFGYNPPQFIINAAKEALNKVDCNQYSPTRGRPRLKKAIADAYSPLWGRKLNPETEVTITTGANEGRWTLGRDLGKRSYTNVG